MRVGRRKPPVLAEVSGDRPERPGTLRRRDLEAYGGLLERLHDDRARTVLMTGSREARREGAVGLATTAVAAGTRTALLECDLVEPGLTDALGLARAPGLYEHLRGAATAESILVPVVLAGPGSAGVTDPLVCVPAGRPSAEGPQLFDSGAFVRVVAGLRAAYDLVVIDGPPLRDEHSLRALLPLAETTIACLGPNESRSLPVTVDGLLIQG